MESPSRQFAASFLQPRQAAPPSLPSATTSRGPAESSATRPSSRSRSNTPSIARAHTLALAAGPSAATPTASSRAAYRHPATASAAATARAATVCPSACSTHPVSRRTASCCAPSLAYSGSTNSRFRTRDRIEFQTIALLIKPQPIQVLERALLGRAQIMHDRPRRRRPPPHARPCPTPSSECTPQLLPQQRHGVLRRKRPRLPPPSECPHPQAHAAGAWHLCDRRPGKRLLPAAPGKRPVTARQTINSAGAQPRQLIERHCPRRRSPANSVARNSPVDKSSDATPTAGTRPRPRRRHARQPPAFACATSS